MDLEMYKQLLVSQNVSDNDVYEALIAISNDAGPLLPEISNGELRRLTKKHRPEVIIRFDALLLEIFTYSLKDKITLAEKVGLGENASYLDIARAIQEEKERQST